MSALKREQAELRESVHELMWHLRGGLSREEAWTLSAIERKELQNGIKSRIETVETTGLALL